METYPENSEKYAIKLEEEGKLRRIDNLLSDVEQNIKVILLTRKGEKIHEPEFGCGVWELLDRSLSEVMPRIIAEIYKAINRWEKRVEIIKVVPLESDSSGHFTCEIHYRIKATETYRTLQVTF